jgi:hypothetical protein
MNNENIEEILKNIGAEEIPADVHKIAQETSNNFSSSLRQTKQSKRLVLLEQIMKSRITKLAAAAIIIIACFTGLHFWRSTGSGIVLADVLTRIDNVKAFRFKETKKKINEVPSGKPSIWQINQDYLVSKEYGTVVKFEQLNPKGERANLGDLYFNPAENTFVGFVHTQKLYIRAELDSFLAQQLQKNVNRYSDTVAVLKEIAASKYESIGRSTIDGIEVEGFRTTDPNCAHDKGSWLEESQVDVKLWIDVKTCLPVRYESLRTGLDHQGARVSFQVVMYDFQWDITVDASEFEPPPIPEGYTAQVKNIRETINEQAATEGLRQCVELFGKYPESLRIASSSDPSSYLESELNKSDTPGAVQLKEELKGLAELERAKRLADARTCLECLFWFYMDLTNDKKDPAYYGKTVTPKDADKVLMRWKLSDNEYRVIYGDLHAETVTPEKLAELEAALSK